MLLVTFHGGKGGVNNVYGYSTKRDVKLPQTKPQTKQALSVPANIELDELRGISVYQSNLYVINGGDKTSNVLVFQGPPQTGPLFEYLDTVIGKGQSIMHPFGIAFQSPTICYVSDQDSNVVARITLTTGAGGTVTGSLGSGCQSAYLTSLYPPASNFLDGTMVASQNGNLVGVPVIAPNVPQNQGGLNVLPAAVNNQPVAPSNSVRDVAVANAILFVCDEVDSQVNMYSLSGGTYLGSGSLPDGPTHIALGGGGLWVSAGASLSWSALPASTQGASLTFQQIAIGVPGKNKIGGISFEDSGNVYVIFQDGTGGTGSGSIQKYKVTPGAPPTLSNATVFATIAEDTPEFCLWVSDSHWPA